MISGRKSKFLLLACAFTFLLFTFTFSFAQHEGHKMQGQTKEEAKPKIKKPASKKAVYYCPMHPTYTSDKPGDCPICNMKLVLKEEAEAIEEKVKTPRDICILHNCPMLAQGKTCPMLITGDVKDCPYCGAHLANDKEDEGFYISSEKQQLIGVKTDKVIYRPLVRTLRTVGRVAFDPELYKSQQEYIEAVKTLEKINSSEDKTTISNIQSLVEAAALKLKLSGLSQEQIEDLAKNKENDETLLISSDETTWVYATIYEYETDWISVGQDVTIKTISYPDKEFKGKIVSLDPIFDAMTRSIRARIKTDNPEDLLKPNMFVDVEIYSDLGAYLAVPKEAVMDTGTRKMVFISLPEGYFKPQEIKIGVSTDEYAQVKEGLKEGDLVVVSGNFLIDSESKLKSALEGTGHQHGQ